MLVEKLVDVVTVGTRKFVKDGKEMTFHDLSYVVSGEGVGTVGVTEEFAVFAAQRVGKQVLLRMELAPDRKVSWLYSLSVIGVQDADKPARSA